MQQFVLAPHSEAWGCVGSKDFGNGTHQQTVRTNWELNRRLKLTEGATDMIGTYAEQLMGFIDFDGQQGCCNPRH